MKCTGGRITWVALMAVILAIGLGTTNAGAVTNLKAAISMSPPEPAVLMLSKLAELVKAKTGGSIEITVYHSSQLGGDQQIQQGVRVGTIDMGCIGLPWHTSFAPGIGVLNLPYLFRDYAEAYAVLDGEIGQELASKYIESNGMKVLGYPEAGFRQLSNSKRVVRKPEDVKGLKIRTTNDLYHIAAWKAWGAMPVAMSVAEIYMALQTGTVDGQENPVAGMLPLKLYEVQKYLSMTNHAYTAYGLDMNLKKFQSFSPSEQKALLDAAKESIQYERTLMRQQDELAMTEMKKKGLIILDNPDRDAFARMTGSAYELYTKQFGTEYLDKIKAIRK